MPPLILVTNDDGIQSPGLKSLARTLARVGEVVVVAPSRQQSAASHKITIDQPLRVRRLTADRFAVDGTPVDAVFLALHRLLPRSPDLVVSGINHGPNLGNDIFYSGTVAAALEAAQQGIQAIAVSQGLPAEDVSTGPGRAPDPALADREQSNLVGLLDHAACFAMRLSLAVLATPLPAGVALNVNCPDRLAADFCWTTIGQRIYSGEVVERLDPRGVPYFWIGGAIQGPDGPTGTDSRAIRDGSISVSPLRANWNIGLPEEAAQWSLDGFRALPTGR